MKRKEKMEQFKELALLDLEAMEVNELKEKLTERGIKFTPKSTKKALVQVLLAAMVSEFQMKSVSKTKSSRRKLAHKQVVLVRKKKEEVKDDKDDVVYVPKWTLEGRRVKKIESDQVFKNGCLVILNTKKWMATARIDKENFKDDIPKNLVRGVQELLEDKSEIEELIEIKRAAVRLIKSWSLPFPVYGLYFVVKEAIPTIDAKMVELKSHWDGVLERFISNYKSRIASFKTNHPKLYRANKYPRPDTLKDMFHFSWSFRVFDVPSADMKEISPAMYKRQVESMKQDVETMRNETMAMVGKALHDRIASLQSQCVDDKVNARTVNSIHKILDKWDDLYSGFIGHTQLKKVIDDAKKMMNDNRDADRLKDDSAWREKIAKSAEALVKGIVLIPEVQIKKKRKLDV